jgi:hypothetical protein
MAYGSRSSQVIHLLVLPKARQALSADVYRRKAHAVVAVASMPLTDKDFSGGQVGERQVWLVKLWEEIY